MKSLLVTSLFILTASVSGNEEFNIQVNIANQDITIVKTYVGEPVSKRRRLVVTQNCGSKKIEIFNDKYCDFSDFKMKEDSLSFTAKLYNPDTGECTSPNTKSFNLDIKKNCK